MSLMAARSSSPVGIAAGRRWAFVLLVSTWAWVGGCENPNEVFSGRWGPPISPESGTSSAIDLGEGLVWPQLHLGHYGQEVAGVVTFHTTELVTSTTSSCSCAFVEHRHLNLDAQTLVFTTHCSSVGMDWDLAITRDVDGQAFLEGTVHRLDDPDTAQPLRLERLVDSVDPFDPFCEEGAP